MNGKFTLRSFDFKYLGDKNYGTEHKKSRYSFPRYPLPHLP